MVKAESIERTGSELSSRTCYIGTKLHLHQQHSCSAVHGTAAALRFQSHAMQTPAGDGTGATFPRTIASLCRSNASLCRSIVHSVPPLGQATPLASYNDSTLTPPFISQRQLKADRPPPHAPRRIVSSQSAIGPIRTEQNKNSRTPSGCENTQPFFDATPAARMHADARPSRLTGCRGHLSPRCSYLEIHHLPGHCHVSDRRIKDMQAGT